MKIGIIVGHSPKLKGARSYLRESEFDYNLKVCKSLMYLLATETTHDPLFFWRDDHIKYPLNLSSMNNAIKEWGAKFCIELHINAAPKEVVASGSEAVFLKMREVPHSFAITWQEILYREHEIKKRQLKIIEHGANVRGLHNLMTLQRLGIDNVILEPCFGHYENREASLILRDPDGYAAILKETITKTFGL